MRKLTAMIVLFILSGLFITLNAEQFTVRDGDLLFRKYQMDDNIYVCCINKDVVQITIPSTIEVRNISYTVTSFESTAFEDCTKLVSIGIPSTIKTFSSGAFRGCSSLRSISIPDGMSEIYYGTFSGCSSLSSITLPNSIEIIGSDAFRDCSSLSSITLPNSIEIIGRGAFRDCSSLESIKLPNTIKKIDSHAFDGCSSLKSIVIPESVSYIGGAAFKECKSIMSIEFNAIDCSCKTCSCEDCDYGFDGGGVSWFPLPFKSLEFGENVKKIPGAFALSHDELESFVIPESVIEIGSTAFCDCKSLNSVEMPRNLTTISSDAFAFCPVLKSITIPESVKEIGYKAFYCTGLTELNYNAINCEVLDYVCWPGSIKKLTIGGEVEQIPKNFLNDGMEVYKI